MTDLATLGIKAQFNEVTAAEKALDNLAKTAGKAEAATKGLEGSSAKAGRGLKETAAAADKATGSVRNTNAAMANMSYQINDIGTSLASGASPFQVLAQQGGQVFQVWQQSPTVFKDTARAIGGVLTPMRLLAGGAIGAGVAALVMAENFKAGQREVERSLAGIGRASGVTVGQINSIAEAEANRARISRGAAREIAAGFAATGNFNGSNITGLTGVTKDFGAQTGRDDAESVARLGKALSSPSQGLQELAKEIGGVDAKTLNYVRTLEEAGDKQAAVAVSIDAIKGSVSGAADRVSFLTRKWEEFKNVLSLAGDIIGGSVTKQITLQDRLAGKLLERAAIERDVIRKLTGNKSSLNASDQDIARLQLMIAAQEDLAKAEASRANAQKDSLAADEISRDFDPLIEKARKLKLEIAALNKISDGERTPGLNTALDAKKNAIASMLTLEQRTTLEGELQVKSIIARTAAEQLSVDLQRQSLQMAGNELTASQQKLLLTNQIAAAQANAARAAQDALRSANDNLSLSGLLPFERAMKQIQIDARKLKEQTSLPSFNVSSISTGAQRDSNAPLSNGYSRVGPFAIPTAGASAMSSAGMSGLDPAFAGKVKALIAAVGDSGAVMTSGFRSREKQQELYDLYGPGKAARPGNSQHERGTAADFTFSSPEARARAMAIAEGQGIRALSSNGGAVHFDQGAAGAKVATAAINDNTAANVRNSQSLQERALRINEIDLPLRQSRIELDQQKAALALQEQGMGMSARAMASAAKEQELLNQFQRQGITLTDSQRASIKGLADGFADVQIKSQGLRLGQDLNFERDQIFRSPGEQQDASRLRGVYGEGYKSELDGPYAAQMRTNRALQEGSTLAGGFFNQLGQGALNGKKGIDVLKDAFKNLLSQGISSASQGLGSFFMRLISGGLGGGGGGGDGGITSLFSAAFSSGKGAFANGGAFGQSNVIPFARGGAFTNSIVNRPTLFPFAKGGAMGVMGEAGPEAIMPLKRGSDGSLGVQMNGGSQQMPNIIIGGTQVTIQGNADSAAINQLRREMEARDKMLPQQISATMQRQNVRRVS